MPRDLPDHRPEVARELGAKGAPALCAELGIDRSRTETGKYVCPRHGGGSLSVRVNRSDGLIQVRCFGCDLAGDVFALIAEVRGLSVRADFRRVLLEGATIAGLWAIADELAGSRVARSDSPPPRRSDAPPRSERAEPIFPDTTELAELWASAGPVVDDAAACAMLKGRGLDAATIDADELARVVPASATLPAWCRSSEGSWFESGHRLILPVYDAGGVMRSVRGWRVNHIPNDPKKRLAPRGKASGLVLANEIGVAMLAGTYAAQRVLIAEGEPDFLTWATRRLERATAILGVVSGAWTAEHAARIPTGAHVAVCTHHDVKGDQYAEQVNASLSARCTVTRPEAET